MNPMTEKIEMTKEAIQASSDERSLEYDKEMGRRKEVPEGYFVQLALTAAASKAREGALSGATGIEATVCGDIAARQRMGISKYKTTVADNPLPLRAWLEHAYLEALDQAIYLRRAMDEIDKKKEGV